MRTRTSWPRYAPEGTTPSRRGPGSPFSRAQAGAAALACAHPAHIDHQRELQAERVGAQRSLQADERTLQRAQIAEEPGARAQGEAVHPREERQARAALDVAGAHLHRGLAALVA